MSALRSLAHVAAILALGAVGLALGLWLRDPHPGGLAFVLIVAAAVGVLLWRLYRPGGIAWAPRAAAQPARAEAEAVAAPSPQADSEPEPEPAAAVATPPRSPGARRIELPKGRRRVLGLALGALAIAAIAFIAWPDSDTAPKTGARPASPAAPNPRPQAKPKPKPAPPRAAPKPRPRSRPRPAASPKVSARALGSATLRPDSKGADVRLLQKLLKVPASGKYDAKTEAAVSKFQSAHKLPSTGVVATLTHKALKKAFP